MTQLWAACARLFAWTFKTSLEASVLIAIVFLIQSLFGRWLKPQLRYALGLLILLRFCLPAVPASSWSIFNLKHSLPVRQAKMMAPVPMKLTPSPAPSPSPPPGERVPEGRVRGKFVGPTPELFQGILTATSRGETSRFENGLDGAEVKPARAALHWTWTDSATAIWIAGGLLVLVRVILQHQKLSAWIESQNPVTDGRMINLLDGCKALMKLARPIEVFSTTQLQTPAVFRFWKPCLLLPDELCKRLNDRELRLVFLHELAHIKRRDVLVNWIAILVRSLHWFNPLVWSAMKRLRADQELVCDHLVMSHLSTEDRRLYGNTLLKLIRDLVRVCPSLVAGITNKHEMKKENYYDLEIQTSIPHRRLVFVLGALGAFSVHIYAGSGEEGSASGK